MSNFRFGDDYRLSYYPQEASDGWGGVDWDKVESVEIECDVYVKERTCELEINTDMTAIRCNKCGYKLPKGTDLGKTRYCGGCGRKVKR